MAYLNFIIWNANPEIFKLSIPFIGNEITLRWYGVLFAAGFLISQQILYFIYKKESKPEKDVDVLTLYMVIATIIGARLGHVLFYEPGPYLEDPVKILKVWEGGLASHGAAFAILVALWLYARKKKPGQNYFQVVDRIVILVALTGALIRVGNFYNSEIIGKPTHSGYGVVFARNVTALLMKDDRTEKVSFAKVDSSANENGYWPVKMLVDFKKIDFTDAHNFYAIVNRLKDYPTAHNHIDFSSTYRTRLVENDNNEYASIVSVFMIPRHPAQLYESASCLLLFGLLLVLWAREKENLPPGRLLGVFLIVCFGMRFLLEFLKEPQADFENTMTLNMGQILSIPLVLAGIFILALSRGKKQTENSPLN